MANTALKFYNNARCHAERVRKGYTLFLESMNIPKNGDLSVLDIGVGSGRVFQEVLLPLLPKNVTDIVASDMEENMLVFAHSKITDPRVTFEKFNILDKNMPTHLENRFDYSFSSYCFSYVSDLRQGFKNTGKLLKPDGELLNVFLYKKNGLYTTYRRMSAMDEWKKYTKNYANYRTNLAGPNPEIELKRIFEDIGMKLLSFEFDPEYCMDMTKREVLGAYKGLDNIFLTIPKELQESYSKDFLRIFSEETDVDFLDEASLDEDIQFSFPTVVVHASH